MENLNIPGFELLSKIGTGGMATVWKARQISLDRVVAIKVLSSAFAHDPDDVKRFQSEAQQAARLSHPGIVQIHDANMENGIYFIVMEFVDGYSVGEWVRKKGRLSEKQALLICEHVIDALEHAWLRNGIIHCDIKPDNILVDADGSVKVTDLGLARTISSMRAGEEESDILGTPSYMAPEQVVGIPNLDLRTDIYALGASLYHLIVGTPLFHGYQPDQIMSMQTTESVQDPLDVVSGISRPACALMEKMLAKSRDHRHADWNSVRIDINRVKRGNQIAQPIAEGLSTISRSPQRSMSIAASAATSIAQKPEHNSVNFFKIAIVIGLAALLVIIFLISAKNYAKTPVPPARHVVPNSNFQPSPTPARIDPATPPAAQPSPPSQTQNKTPSQRTTEINEGIRRTMRALAEETARLIDEKRYGEAAEIYENYDGDFSEDSRAQRESIASGLRQREDGASEARQKQLAATMVANADSYMQSVLKDLVQSDVRAALVTSIAAKDKDTLAHIRGEISEICILLENAVGIDKRIQDSFLASRGQEITVMLKDGPKKLVVRDARDGRVKGSYSVLSGSASATVEVSFDIKDLAPRERLARMGSETSAPEVALLKGLNALQLRSYQQARSFFELVKPQILAEKLTAYTDQMGTKTTDNSSVNEQIASPAVAEIEQDQKKNLAETEIEENASEITARLAKLTEDVIRQKIQERNPEVLERDIRIIVRHSNSTIRGVEVFSDKLTDLSPFAEMEGLREIRCGGPHRRRPCDLKDLTPLKALNSLTTLEVQATSISDINAIGSLTLKKLTMSHCKITDLSPLRNMVTLESLDVQGTDVKDLTPLRNLPNLRSLELGDSKIFDLRMLSTTRLRMLGISGTQIKDISVIRDMPLQELNLAGSKVFNFAVLRGLPIQRLDVSNTQFRDLSLLRGLPLKALFLRGVSVNDIALLRGFNLEEISIARTNVRDASPLSAMPLRDLDVRSSRIDDLSFARNLPLVTLDISNTKISDLSPVAGKGITSLQMEGTQVRDLKPIAGMPLHFLNCRNAPIASYEPLRGTPIRNLDIDEPDKNMLRILRTLPNLMWVNGTFFER